METEDKNLFPNHRRISFMIDNEDNNYFTQFSTNVNNEHDENEIAHYKFNDNFIKIIFFFIF